MIASTSVLSAAGTDCDPAVSMLMKVLGCSPQESGAPLNFDGTPFPGHAPLIVVIEPVITGEEYSRLAVVEQD